MRPGARLGIHLLTALLLAGPVLGCNHPSTPPQQSEPTGGLGFPEPLTVCLATQDAKAVVRCRFTAVGPTVLSFDAGLATVPGFDIAAGPPGDPQPVDVSPFTIVASDPLVGTLTAVVNGFALPANVTEPDGFVGQPMYADGGWAPGYCFLTTDDGQWVLEMDGFFQESPQDAGLLQNDNLYREGISLQDFLAAIESSLDAGCPKPCDIADAGSCPAGEYCSAVSDEVTYVCVVADGG